MDTKQIRLHAGEWRNVTYRVQGDEATRVQMPREDQHDGTWRFTDKGIGVEFFHRYEDVIAIKPVT